MGKFKKKSTSTAKWRIVGVEPGLIIWKENKIDLSNITGEEAEKLIAEGCPYVVWEADAEPVVDPVTASI